MCHHSHLLCCLLVTLVTWRSLPHLPVATAGIATLQLESSHAFRAVEAEGKTRIVFLNQSKDRGILDNELMMIQL